MELKVEMNEDNMSKKSSPSSSSAWFTMNIVFWTLGVALLLCLNMAAVLLMYPIQNHHHHGAAPTSDDHGVPVEYWVLKEATFTRLCETKKILTMNGMFPGPALYLRRGQRMKVNVLNQGKYGVTIHWHGVKQPRNPWSDGAESITQCKMEPGLNYTYEIILSDEEGTLWWHAHSDWTRATVHGPIIIYPEEGRPYPFPKPYKEIPIVLASWFKVDVMTEYRELLISGAHPAWCDAYTINGQPGDTNACSSQDMVRIPVEYGKTYLLRIVNAVLLRDQFFMIADHNLTVVAIDASYTKPFSTSYLQLSAGQTMDVLLTANQNPNCNYYMAVRPYVNIGSSYINGTALLQYTTNDTSPTSFPFLPSANDSAAAVSFTSQFRALNTEEYPVDVPKTVQRKFFVTLSIGTVPCEPGRNCSGPHGYKRSAGMNNISFPYPPSIDILQAYYKNIEGVYKTDFPVYPENPFNWTLAPDFGKWLSMLDRNGTRVVEMDYGTNVEIVFQDTNYNNDSGSHPMHLHGYSFYQIGLGLGNFNESIDPKTYNLEDPPLLNTMGVPQNGWSVIRFTAKNPGVWFMHCHLDHHAMWGMDTAFIVKNGPTPETSIRPPPDYVIPCHNNSASDLKTKKASLLGK